MIKYVSELKTGNKTNEKMINYVRELKTGKWTNERDNKLCKRAENRKQD